MSLLGHPIVALMISVAFLWTANGLFHSLLGLRMSQEGFDTTVAGTVASAYFVGQLLGAAICGRIIESVGHVRSFAAFASVISACAVAHAIFVDPFFWGGLRFATGICIAGALMVAESWLNGAERCDQPRRNGHQGPHSEAGSVLYLAACQLEL